MLEADLAEKTFWVPFIHYLSYTVYAVSWACVQPLEQKGHEICAFRSLLGRGTRCVPSACNSTRHPVGTQEIFAEWRALIPNQLQDPWRHGSVSFTFVSAFSLARSILEWGWLRVKVHINQCFWSFSMPSIVFYMQWSHRILPISVKGQLLCYLHLRERTEELTWLEVTHWHIPGSGF